MVLKSHLKKTLDQEVNNSFKRDAIMFGDRAYEDRWWSIWQRKAFEESKLLNLPTRPNPSGSKVRQKQVYCNEIEILEVLNKVRGEKLLEQ